METERQRMDDDNMSNDEIRPEEEGATPHPSPPASMSDRRERAAGDEGFRDPLLPADRTSGYRERWDDIQGRFVDDPRTSVEQADKLVIEVVQDLQTTFGSERSALEAQWQRGDDIQTEDLRVSFQRYRTFFDRLLST
jgi:hypothetical protein